MTPDKVETRLGTLNFVDGVPTAETTQKVYDNLDFLRGTEVFLNFIPATSMEGLRLGNAERGATKSNQVVIMDQLADSNPLWLTANTDTVYLFGLPRSASGWPDRGRDSARQRTRHGQRRLLPLRHRHGRRPAPMRGKGGKYLIVPPGYKGELPKDKKDGGEYFVSRSPSYVNWLIAARLPRRRQDRMRPRRCFARASRSIR